jgi:hypothetical protein
MIFLPESEKQYFKNGYARLFSLNTWTQWGALIDQIWTVYTYSLLATNHIAHGLYDFFNMIHCDWSNSVWTWYLWILGIYLLTSVAMLCSVKLVLYANQSIGATRGSKFSTPYRKCATSFTMNFSHASRMSAAARATLFDECCWP